jgi:hypothetical protein
MRSDWLRVDNIQRRVASQLTVDEFNREFGVPNQPVLLEGAALHWPAMQEWTQQNLIDRYGDQIFTAEAMDIRMRDYWRYCNQLDSDDDSPFYLFDKRCFTRPETSELATHFTVPPYFAEDLFALLPVDQRPDYRWLIIGPRWSGSSFHKDPNGTSAWNATISGSKKWVFYPPNSIPPGVMVSDDQSEVRTPSSLKEWFQYYYRQATTNRSGLPPPIECITRPGDVVFVPSGWWHCVVNLEPSVAVTQNFVCAANLKRVLHFLRHRAHQISGVGCDAADSLHDRFINSLISAKRPELAALDRADDKENCKRQKLSFWSDTVSRANNNSNDVEGNAGKSSITKQEFTFSFNLEI